MLLQVIKGRTRGFGPKEEEAAERGGRGAPLAASQPFSMLGTHSQEPPLDIRATRNAAGLLGSLPGLIARDFPVQGTQRRPRRT